MGSDSNNKTKLEEDICIHIFTVSSAMVGVCLTVIGLIRVVITLGKADTLADDLLASDALLFLTSCLLSYAALRARSLRRMHRIERAADVVFIVAMVMDDRYLRFHHILDFSFFQPRTLVTPKATAQLVIRSFRFFKRLPCVPGAFPVLFCRPGLSLQQME